MIPVVQEVQQAIGTANRSEVISLRRDLTEKLCRQRGLPSDPILYSFALATLESRQSIARAS